MTSLYESTKPSMALRTAFRVVFDGNSDPWLRISPQKIQRDTGNQVVIVLVAERMGYRRTAGRRRCERNRGPS